MKKLITTTCPFCNRNTDLYLEEADVNKWEEGATVQSAFPYLPPEKRELLISGICASCWDKLFSSWNKMISSF
jgi:hypothetical protein